MPQHRIQFAATEVTCSEAMDWEIIHVSLGVVESGSDVKQAESPYLTISVNFELGRDVGLEFYDGYDYDGDRLDRIELWRNRVFVISNSGHEFDIDLRVSDEVFTQLREYLKTLLRYDSYRE